MLAIILDPPFKNMKIIATLSVMFKPLKLLLNMMLKFMPYFIVGLFALLLVKRTMEGAPIEDDDMLFGLIMSNDDAVMPTMRNELQLLQQFFLGTKKLETFSFDGYNMQCNFWMSLNPKKHD